MFSLIPNGRCQAGYLLHLEVRVAAEPCACNGFGLLVFVGIQCGDAVNWCVLLLLVSECGVCYTQ